MASTSAISGLVSGLDTKTIISQLMSLAKAPQDDLKTSLAKTNTQITAAQSINSKAASMTSLAKELAAAKTYTVANATSSNPSVTATASATATSGSITFSVDRVAQPWQRMTDAVPAATDIDPTATRSFSIMPPGKSASADAIDFTGVADNAVAIAAAINNYSSTTKPLNITATVVSDGTNQRLLLSSTVTGADNVFSTRGIITSGSDDAMTDVQGGVDAKISIRGSGGGNTGGVVYEQASNTFKGLMPGVDVTVSAKTTDTPITVSTAVNQSAITSKVNSLVTAMNNVLSDVAFHTKALATGTVPSATNGGLLRGNSTMRDLASQVLNSVSSGTPGGDNATLAGLSVTRQGQVTFDSAAFDKLYKSDPTKAADVLAKFAAAVQATGSQASDATSGSVTGFINGSQTTVKTLTANIAGWDERLASKQKRLEAQYGALEVALQKLSGQSDSLTAALKQVGN